MKLPPMKMHPAFRYGSDTPWGGAGLAAFGKALPDPRTGESLELSALPGLESRDEGGRTLSELLERYGADLTGTAVGTPFPLMLKLLHAREWLSVQVHPSDAYAAAHEGGKLGKTEAWVILSAEPGAEVIYGVAPGVDRQGLQEALREGRMDACLRRVPVAPGDVLNIPAGTVHALGPGIALAEIQQTSDVTYRLFDWNRGRALHIDRGLDVLTTQPCEKAVGTPIEQDGMKGLRYVCGPAFTLDRMVGGEGAIFSATPERFRILLALGEGKLTYADGAIELHPGTCVLLPAQLQETRLSGACDLLLMAPVPA